MRHLTLAALIGALALPAAAQDYTLRFNHVLGPNEPFHQGFLDWAERVNERTDGRLEIEVFHSAQLGVEEEPHALPAQLQQHGVRPALAHRAPHVLQRDRRHVRDPHHQRLAPRRLAPQPRHRPLRRRRRGRRRRRVPAHCRRGRPGGAGPPPPRRRGPPAGRRRRSRRAHGGGAPTDVAAILPAARSRGQTAGEERGG